MQRFSFLRSSTIRRAINTFLNQSKFINKLQANFSALCTRDICRIDENKYGLLTEKCRRSIKIERTSRKANPTTIKRSHLLDDSKGCCIFSSLCRFCKNSKAKCYVQEKLFVGWCNFYLRLVGCEITSLADLWDWTCFLALLDGLSRDREANSNSAKDGQEIGINENWDIVQEYLIKENVVKSFIANGKSPIFRKKFTYWLTEILWSLIFRHYFDFSVVKMNCRASIDYHKATQSLLKWIKVKIPQCRVSNITSDLKNGIAFCHLINAIAPNSVDPSVFTEILNDEDVVNYALDAAKEILGIPTLISASDIVDSKADEKSLITYLALFRSADRMLARGIRPVSPRPREQTTLNKESLQRPRRSKTAENAAYGFGIRYGEVGKPTEFIVHLDKQQKSDLHISIKCTPDSGEIAKANAEPRLKPIGDCDYVISYTPILSGYYEISVLCGYKHIQNSPFQIKVSQPKIEFKCYSEGNQKLSIEPRKPSSDGDYLIFADDNVIINENEFEICNGSLKRPESLSTTDSGIDNAVYIETLQNDLHSGNECSERGSSFSTLTTSPFAFSKGGSNSSILSDFDFFEVQGAGIHSGEVGVMSHFMVRTPNGSNGPLSVLVTCPAVSIPTPYVNTRSDGDQLIHDVMFLPTEPGSYEIELKWGNKLIAGSPYRVNIIEANNNSDFDTNTVFDEFLNEDVKLEKKAVLYYCATSIDKRHNRRRRYLESILQSEISNLELESVAIDLDLSPEKRKKILSKTGNKIQNRGLPFVFLNRKFLGDFETLVGKYRNGSLKQHINEKFEYLALEETNGFIDIKTLKEIKSTLNELKAPFTS